ncbi:Aste57867_13191 [Aphanomyces stellatus]|uniref:Aste57867_13191 protein n=1 Tax=Aphanomyces stellatus TaxID=120398 RepID=A0A485KYD1_9STRA|nr:hypothetical protein As57867_013142 [Aphanomyces stellatus]VFT90032.1 Aste57867_13191 [Aphanomyces stellatus]
MAPPPCADLTAVVKKLTKQNIALQLQLARLKQPAAAFACLDDDNQREGGRMLLQWGWLDDVKASLGRTETKQHKLRKIVHKVGYRYALATCKAFTRWKERTSVDLPRRNKVNQPTAAAATPRRLPHVAPQDTTHTIQRRLSSTAAIHVEHKTTARRTPQPAAPTCMRTPKLHTQATQTTPPGGLQPRQNAFPPLIHLSTHPRTSPPRGLHSPPDIRPTRGKSIRVTIVDAPSSHSLLSLTTPPRHSTESISVPFPSHLARPKTPPVISHASAFHRRHSHASS